MDRKTLNFALFLATYGIVCITLLAPVAFAQDKSSSVPVQNPPAVSKPTGMTDPKQEKPSSVSVQNPPTVSKSAGMTDAKKAFEKLKTLSGTWQGSIMDIPIKVTIRGTSSGTAILHEAHTDADGPPKNEITLFYLEGDTFFATHYCDAGNRARFQGKLSEDGQRIDFSFLDVAGSTRGGLVKRLAFTLKEGNMHVVEFTFVMPNGNPIELKGEFRRLN